MIDTLYRKGQRFLHLYDSRLKLLLLPLLVAYFFLPLPLPVLGGGLVFLAFTAAAALGGRDLIVPVRMIFPLLILIFLLTPLFLRQGTPLLQAGGVVLLTREGLAGAAVYACRLLGITGTFFLFFRTTPMEDLLLGLSWFRFPYVLTLIISVSLRYIPHLAGLYGQIAAAHALRCSVGDPPARKGPWTRLGKIFPILVSLMIQSVKTIPVLTMALELKGIGRDNPRTRLRRLPAPPRPALQIFLTLLLLVLLLLSLLLWL